MDSRGPEQIPPLRRRARLRGFPGFHHEYRRALRNLVADLHLHILDYARRRRRNFHRRLVRLEGDERLLLRHGVARLDQHLDHFDFLEIADVGNGNRHGSGGLLRGFGLCSLGFRLLLGRRFAVAPVIQVQDRRAFGDLVSNLDLQFLDHAGTRRRDLHGRLVGLERDERLLLRHGVARLHQNLDDLDFLEVSDVGDQDLAHTVVGSALSGSMPYFLIASATAFALPSPWSASAFSAAIATK